MYLFYSIGFLIASLVQAGIVMLTEYFNISHLNVNISLWQILVHIIAGQIAGYILLVFMRKINWANKVSPILIGVLYGLLFYVVIIPTNISLGKINAPWTAGLTTVLSGLSAFLLFGIISVYTIKIVGVKNKATSK